jgi:enoyl-CoA hydratase/carnithine racemase
MLARIETSGDGERLSRASHAVLNRIAGLGKPVVCALNGMAVGGGNELAMACHARIAREGLRVLAMQPEPNLGIIPGAGGTQRLPRLIGVEAAWEILRTGRPVSAQEALERGLVSELVAGERLRDRAVAVVAEAAAGAHPLPAIPDGPIPVPDELPDVDIGHLSTAVDTLIQRAVREGAATDLATGLELEIRLFGQGCDLEDRKIGVRNFIENGPREEAAFLHR